MNLRKITAGIVAFTSAAAMSLAVLPDGISFIGGTDTAVSAAQEAFFISEGEENGIKYQLWGYADDKPEYAVVSGTTKRGTLTIPEKIAGYQVREIGSNAFYGNSEITRVDLPSTVEKIGENAFRCTSIVSINVPDNVKVIGNCAFDSCYMLKSVVIGSGVETIASGAFQNCTAIDSLKFNTGDHPVLKTIGDAAFNYCRSLTSVTIPDSVEKIGVWAFQYCESLESCTLPSGLTEISRGLFYGCSSLKGIKIPDSVEVIDQAAFRQCSSLTSVSIPDSVYSVGEEAFAYCYGLSSVKLSKGMNVIMKETFVYCSKLEKIELPENIDIIKSGAFSNCDSLKSITIPENTMYIEDYSIGYTVFRHEYEYRNADLVICGVNGSYAEKYADEFGFTFKSVAKETLAVTSQPVSVTKNEGETAKFTAAASGSGLKYQWYWRNNANEAWTASTGTGYNTNTLTVAGEAKRNGYQYYCKITDDSGASVKTNTVTLTVKAALAVTAQPASKTVTEGTAVKFTVTAGGTGLKYQWYWRKNSSESWAASTGTGYNTNTLTVAGETKRNGYQYYCKITDASGNTVKTNTVTLTVKAGTFAVVSQPKDQTASDGETAKFTVAASGTGLKYQWYWRKNSEGTWAASTVTGATTATLSVTATGARNGYQYRCVIKDTASGKSITTDAAELKTVYMALQPKSQTAEKGTTVLFTSAVNAENVTYQWYWRKPGTTEWKESTANGAKTVVLTIAAADSRNGYQYRCAATDRATGKMYISDIATLTVK